MTNNSEKDQEQIEIRSQTVTEYLERTPPNQITFVTDLVARPYVGRYPMNTPILRLHCPNELCSGVRFFRSVNISNEGNDIRVNSMSYFYVTYQCSNCQETRKMYFVAAQTQKDGHPHGHCYKFGEL